METSAPKPSAPPKRRAKRTVQETDVEVAADVTLGDPD
jgi:hypothetical protein